MNPDEIAAELCRKFEGFRSRPYLCPAGIPTIGYGFTRYPDGRAVTLLDPPMSRESADAILIWFIVNRYLPQTMKLCPMLDTPGRMGAIADFCFNLGQGNLRASTLRRRINEQRWEDVPKELMKWVRGGGRVLPGLVSRRTSEAALI